jgi:hypothetical protein
MLFTNRIYKPTNSGSPSHNLCGGSPVVVSFTNLNLSLKISKDGINTTTLVNTSDLSTLNTSILPYGVIATYGDLDVNFVGFLYVPSTGTWGARIDFLKAGTSQPVLHEKLFVHVSISKSGYSSYSNAIEVYGYDVGYSTITTNPQFDVYLIPTSDFDSYGRQQNAFSRCTAIRKPFSNEISIYNLVGTQGTISYYDSNDNTISYGNGNRSIIHSDISIDIQQKVVLFNGDSCTYDYTSIFIQWKPTINSTSSCAQSCGDGCITNSGTPNPIVITSIIDYTNVGTVALAAVLVFPTQFMNGEIVENQYDNTGILINTQEVAENLTYATYLSNPSVYGVKTINFTTSSLTIGDNVISVSLEYSNYTDDLVLISCYQNLIISACNWWTIDKTGECGTYTFTNHKLSSISLNNSVTIILSKLSDDNLWVSLTTYVVPANTSVDITIPSDGIYLVSVPNIALNITEYYTIVSFCTIEKCWLDYLEKTICCPPKDRCKVEDQYDFFAFTINAQTFFLLLNEEFNLNYIDYSAINPLPPLTNLNLRLPSLQLMSTFIKRLSNYCTSCDVDCSPCKKDDDCD